MGVADQRESSGGGLEEDVVAGQAGADAECDREVGRAGRPEQDEVFITGEEVELGELQDVGLAGRELNGEVDLVDRLARGNPAALIRDWALCMSRLSISALSSTAAKRS